MKRNSLVFNYAKFDKVIQDYSFIFISEENQLINQNIQNSKVIIIDKNDHLNEKAKDKFIIICFEKTLIIHKQSMIFSLYTLLSKNLNLSVCFLKNIKEIDKEQIKNPLIEYDDIFEEEIENFRKNLYMKKISDISSLWPFVSPCILGYLIKKSYLKISNNRTQNFNVLEGVNQNDYIELRNLGYGSLFFVQLIYHIERGELFALKKPNSGYKEINRLIEREKNCYEKIYCPFIPKFYGTIKVDASESIIIEFINGQTLNKCHINKYKEDDIILMVYKLLFIVECFHSNNLLIRDLKPNNLMITETNDIVMIDFDHVISNSIQECSHNLINEFAAPEVETKDLYSKKSDIYSLGRVIEFILKEANQNMKILKIDDIIKQCIEEDADQRPLIKKNNL